VQRLCRAIFAEKKPPTDLLVFIPKLSPHLHVGLNAPSRLELLELVEMRIIMCNIDAVYLRAGKHEYID
jgi:hypothetical protein